MFCLPPHSDIRSPLSLPPTTTPLYLHVATLNPLVRSPGLPDAWNEIINFDITVSEELNPQPEPTQPCSHFCLALGIRILIIRDTRIVILRGRTEKKLQWANVAVSLINPRMCCLPVYPPTPPTHNSTYAPLQQVDVSIIISPATLFAPTTSHSCQPETDNIMFIIDEQIYLPSFAQ